MLGKCAPHRAQRSLGGVAKQIMASGVGRTYRPDSAFRQLRHLAEWDSAWPVVVPPRP
jgi:hypothetical protein